MLTYMHAKIKTKTRTTKKESKNTQYNILVPFRGETSR